MPPSTFGNELRGRTVVIANGSSVGTLIDAEVDGTSGELLHIVVEIGADSSVETSKWSLNEQGYILIPIGQISRIDTQIHLED